MRNTVVRHKLLWVIQRQNCMLVKTPNSYFFNVYLFIYCVGVGGEREHAWGSQMGQRERERIPHEERDHDLSWNQELDAWPTEPLRCSILLSNSRLQSTLMQSTFLYRISKTKLICGALSLPFPLLLSSVSVFYCPHLSESSSSGHKQCPHCSIAASSWNWGATRGVALGQKWPWTGYSWSQGNICLKGSPCVGLLWLIRWSIRGPGEKDSTQLDWCTVF